MKAWSRGSLTILILGLAAFGFMGCASRQVIHTEPGYKPTHIAVGDIIAYTGGQGMIKQSDLNRLITQQLEDAFRDQDVRFVEKRDVNDSGVTDANLALLDVEVTFLPSPTGMANSYNLRFTYTLKRKSDGAVFDQGSAVSTDATVSASNSMDMNSAIRYAAIATTKKVKAHLEGRMDTSE